MMISTLSEANPLKIMESPPTGKDTYPEGMAIMAKVKAMAPFGDEVEDEVNYGDDDTEMGGESNNSPVKAQVLKVL
jgi:hypothetical protein